MKRFHLVLLAAMISSAAAAAHAERLELGLAMTSTWIHDESYEAFSTNNFHTGRFGADIRTEVANLKGFRIIPFLGYRFAFDTGNPYWSLDTTLKSHDFMLGLRVRKGIFSWMAAFAELQGGALLYTMDAELESPGIYFSDLAPLYRYADRSVTWSVGALLGLEFTMSRTRLRRRGITRFCFGGEVAGGYIRRGDISFNPSLRGGGANAIVGETVGDWGTLNPSGGMMQFAFNFYFF